MHWANQASRDIRRANLDGTSQEIVVRNQNIPAGVALDSSNGHIYWSNVGGGDIRRANLDGTGEITLMSGLSGPAFLTLDLSPLRTPDIPAVTRSDGTFTLIWSALMGRSYQVQFKADLAQTDWTNYRAPRTATNTTMTATFSVGAEPQRVFRVGLLP
ncbi:MAG: hypothetical protein KJ072_26725 [Verrucomicrobia bacterium]|nr:hypothetical protein [Verrucomicrobiota bacterium]